MKTIYNFQINYSLPRWEWDKITPISIPFEDRQQAVLLAKELARLFRGEVRLTQGNPQKASGSYFRYLQ